MPLAWTLALRFLRDGRAQSLMITIGVAVGTAVIVFITALIGGLQANIVARTLGTQAQIQISAPDLVARVPPAATPHLALQYVDARAQRLRAINDASAIERGLGSLAGVTAVAGSISGPGFALRGDAVRAVSLIGIVPATYQRIIPLASYVEAGQFRVGANDALVGSILAQDLGLRVGSKLRVQASSGAVQVFNVSGILGMGVRDLDERVVYLGLKPAQALLGLPGGVTRIDVKLAHIFDAENVAQRIHALTNLKAESWMQTNSQLLNALKSQTLTTQMIRVFVAMSVALGIASVLAVSVVQRTREIGILRAMGATRRRMLAVFLIQGALLGLVGSAIGALLGTVLLITFNTLGPHLFPIPISPWLLLGAMALATLAGVLAAALPALRAARLDPVVAIRYV